MRAEHPLRAIRAIVNAAVLALGRDFAALYADDGYRLLRRSCCWAMLLQAFYSLGGSPRTREHDQKSVPWFLMVSRDLNLLFPIKDEAPAR